MSKRTVPWWSSMRLGKPESTPDTDYADMGTAFGLDASLPEGEAAPLQPQPNGDLGPSTDRLNRRSVI